MWISLRPSKVILTEWNIFVDLIVGSEHFVGFDQYLERGRVSTAIQSYDKKTGIGVTQSGSQYQTVGDPGSVNLGALHVLKQVSFYNEVNHFWKYPIDVGSGHE
mgnify:CR=1 FL=1